MFSPPSEPFGLRLPLRTRWSFRIASASWRGIGVCRRPRVVAERSSTTTSSDAALALPSRGGRAVSSCMVCTLGDGGRSCSPTTEVNYAPRCRSDRQINRVRRGRRSPLGSDGGEGFPPVAVRKGDREAGSAFALMRSPRGSACRSCGLPEAPHVCVVQIEHARQLTVDENLNVRGRALHARVRVPSVRVNARAPTTTTHA